MIERPILIKKAQSRFLKPGETIAYSCPTCLNGRRGRCIMCHGEWRDCECGWLNSPCGCGAYE